MMERPSCLEIVQHHHVNRLTRLKLRVDQLHLASGEYRRFYQ